MDILAGIKTLDLEAEDPLRDFVLQTWMRVASCLGHDFIPYLSYTMPQVMQSVALEAGFTVSDSSLLSSTDDTEAGWDAIDIGDTVIYLTPQNLKCLENQSAHRGLGRKGFRLQHVTFICQ
jgi:hypothetical protein